MGLVLVLPVELDVGQADAEHAVVGAEATKVGLNLAAAQCAKHLGAGKVESNTCADGQEFGIGVVVDVLKILVVWQHVVFAAYDGVHVAAVVGEVVAHEAIGGDLDLLRHVGLGLLGVAALGLGAAGNQYDGCK